MQTSDTNPFVAIGRAHLVGELATQLLATGQLTDDNGIPITIREFASLFAQHGEILSSLCAEDLYDAADEATAAGDDALAAGIRAFALSTVLPQ